MKLYFSPGACSLSPHIVAREAGLPIELERVDLGTKQTAGGADFKQINPKGYVPVLQLDDGEILTEGPAIVQYLSDLRPESGLAPAAGTRPRARLQEWLNFISTELHKSFGVLFNKMAPGEWKAQVREKIGDRFTYVASKLEGRPYLLGDQFTVADAYLFTVLGWAGYVHMDLSPWPALGAFVARVSARPAVQEALKAEGLLK